MDLPTYTNIWRIEKRLYKLYDLRLPTPLPIVWIGIFAGVLAPWAFLLYIVGLPFQTPWHVVYLVPPGIVTWLSTRPVIENKRLTEVMQSQLRYMGEPRAWTRMAPAAEPEAVTFSGRVWRVLPVRAKAPKKARHAMRKPATAPAPSVRSVQPAVAAAAAAATSAPVATPPTRWGAAAPGRRGTAPALATAAQLSPAADPIEIPVRQADPAPFEPTHSDQAPEQAHPEQVRPEPARPGPARPEPVRLETVRPEPVRPEPVQLEAVRLEAVRQEVVRPQAAVRPQGADAETARPEPARPEAPRPEAARPDVVRPAAARGDVRAVGAPGQDVAGAGHEAAGAGRVPEKGVAAGKPIDAEALRRLRRLAATADPGAAVQGPPLPEASGEQEPGAQVPDEALLQHRKGQPPRPGAPLPLPGGQPAWPSAKEAKEPKPVTNPLTKPVTNPAAKPVSDPGGKPVTGPAAKPVTDPGAKPVTSPVAKPVMNPVPKPVSKSPVARDHTGGEQVGGPGGKRAEAVRPSEGQDERVPGPRTGDGRVRRIESVVGRDSGGWRRIAQVVVGGGGPRTDGSEIDEARARAVFGGSRRIVVLGCTGGAGQSTTALMLGHTLAKIRDDRVVAVDANTGANTLTSRIKPESPETLASLLSGLDRVSGYLTMRGYTSRTSSGLEVIGADTDAGAEQRMSDRTLFSDHRLGQAVHLLDRHYKLAVIDPAAALAARVLPYADQLVLVVPASEEASEAVAMTFEWLDGHGCADLRRRAVIVVNGVSRRSMADVEQAEAVARGRCRAIVRVPWEDELAPDGVDAVDPGQLRAAGRRAYLALAGVVVAGFAAQTVRASEEELASDPPGTRIGER
ncbi:TcpE family conjugal transfer membrane protein [Nonomuraea endophytica]|uniref:MinD-like ATPase involved in chromosome partitioning or flagellar assembly n=1 Tax=Nonomuraea endophytica TaxID=714136 RepID=A0A7W8EJQ0_9ACTN|nr:TcpE family conjugal transfer membrane protein [Nonomuraea endophytica]MBB5080907.1 MinD-like ATPase involved in chromosome partitioning or flagellar assembly [Nonomuraea endophytica]